LNTQQPALEQPSFVPHEKLPLIFATPTALLKPCPFKQAYGITCLKLLWPDAA